MSLKCSIRGETEKHTNYRENKASFTYTTYTGDTLEADSDTFTEINKPTVGLYVQRGKHPSQMLHGRWYDNCTAGWSYT